MRFWSCQDDQLFLSRFDAFWDTLKTIERKHKYLSLDPRQRYWMDTYPPLTMGMHGQEQRQKKIRLDLGMISQECQGEIFSLYFHVGFCRSRCAYCRQYEVNLIRDPKHSDLLRRYVDVLKKDIDISVSLFPALQRRTRHVYFGGGTPSLLPARLLGSLLEHLLKRVDLSILSPQSTYELNPQDDVGDLLEMLKAIGLPRISIGVQSFDDRMLHFVGRGYSQGDIFRVIERVANCGFRSINLDLINGFPLHQELGNWKRELECLERLFESGAIQSVTLYMLHPFPKTSLPCHPADAYWQTRNLCFAREYLSDRLHLHEKPIYWFQKEKMETEEAFAPAFSLLGYGNSSYSSLGRWLLQNESSLKAYMEQERENQSQSTLPVKHVFRLTPRQMQIRSLLFAIRSGSFRLGRKDLALMSVLLKKQFQRFVQDGLLERKKDLYRLTEAGKIFAHQMPIFFFDPEAKKNLHDYLDSRFAAQHG